MNHHAATILVVEDHRTTRTFLADNLSADGFDVLEAESVSDARRLLESSFPDLAIVDLGLPDGDGLELLAQVRDADRIAGRLDPDLPLLVLSGRVSELDRLRGFDRGCDDYMIKPFSYHELSARVRALLRRTQAPARDRPAADRIARARSVEPTGVAGRRAGGAVQEGVRAAAGARGGTDQGVHARGAVARRLGLSRLSATPARSTRMRSGCARS